MSDEKTAAAAPAAAGGRFGPWGDPIFLTEFGDSKTGKTTNMLYALAGHAVFIGMEGAFKPAVNTLGFEINPKHMLKAGDIEAATALVPRVAEAAGKAGIDSIGFDDVSELLKATYQKWRAAFPENKTFQLWDHIDLLLSQFRSTARTCGLHALLSAHTKPPGVDPTTGTFYKGGPEVPGKKLTKLLPHLSDTCVRVSSSHDRPDYPHPGVWECSPPDPNWHVGDRHGLQGTSPMNTGEFMRTFCGYPLRRAHALEWMEDEVQRVATILLAGTPTGRAKDEYHAHALGKGLNPRHVRWVWRDAYDRADFLRMKEAKNILAY